MAAQVTPENMSIKDWFNEFAVIKEGLKYHARHSNRHLEEWLNEGNNKEYAHNINSIIVDFAEPHTIKILIELNKHSKEIKD